MKNLYYMVRKMFVKPPCRFEINLARDGRYYLSMVSKNGETLGISGCTSYEKVKDKLRYIEKFVSLYKNKNSYVPEDKTVFIESVQTKKKKPRIKFTTGTGELLIYSEAYESHAAARNLIDMFLVYAQVYC